MTERRTQVQAGVDIYTVKELLGHKDLRMTVRYCHLSPEKLWDAVKVLDAEGAGHVLVTVREKAERAGVAST